MDGANSGGGSGDCWLDASVAVVEAGSSEDAEGTGGSAGLKLDAKGTEGIEGAKEAATSIDGVLATIVFIGSLLLSDFRFFFGGSAISNCAE